jgi:hypothetical protein
VDQDNKDDDSAEHFHEAKLMEDLGHELNDDRPPNAAKGDVLDPVHNWPLRTRHMMHLDSCNYPPPALADDDSLMRVVPVRWRTPRTTCRGTTSPLKTDQSKYLRYCQARPPSVQ